MATNGGGRALNLPIGLIETGYRFDLVALNMRAAASSLRVWPDLDSPLDILQKTINNTEAVNVERVWVDGRLVVGVL